MKPVCTIVTVTTAGTPVALTTDQSISVDALFIQPHPDNGNGPFYIGNTSLVVSTRVGLIYVFPGVTDFWTMPQAQNGANQLSPANYKLDGSNDGDKFLVTWWIA